MRKSLDSRLSAGQALNLPDSQFFPSSTRPRAVIALVFKPVAGAMPGRRGTCLTASPPRPSLNLSVRSGAVNAAIFFCFSTPTWHPADLLQRNSQLLPMPPHAPGVHGESDGKPRVDRLLLLLW